MNNLRLSKIASIQVGYQAKGRIQEREDGTHRLIQGRDFNKDHQLLIKRLVSFFPQRNPDLYLVHKGDILFQARGVENFAFCLEGELEHTLAAGSFYILRLHNKKITPQYLTWWLNQPQTQNCLKSQASGTWMSFISKGTLARTIIPVPTIQTQEKITEINNLWTTECELCTRLSALRGKLVESVCTQAVQE